MNVVIVGAKDRVLESDNQLVPALMQGCVEKYSGCLFVTVAAKFGVGKIIRDTCGLIDGRNQYRYQFVEIGVTLYASGLSNAEASAVYLARNALLFELGHVFYLLADQGRNGALEELISARVAPAGRPYKVLLPGQPLGELL